MKIGIISWKQGGGTNDYISTKPTRIWKEGLKTIKKGQYKGKIPFEKALISAMEHKYKDIEIMYLNKFDEKKLKQNDINFCVSLNLLYAWEKGNKEYQRVRKIMSDPKINIYPNLKEQEFLFNKGGYLNICHFLGPDPLFWLIPVRWGMSNDGTQIPASRISIIKYYKALLN